MTSTCARTPEVEVLEVTEDEERTLLLSIDALAVLAETPQQLRDRLQDRAGGARGAAARVGGDSARGDRIDAGREAVSR